MKGRNESIDGEMTPHSVTMAIARAKGDYSPTGREELNRFGFGSSKVLDPNNLYQKK